MNVYIVTCEYVPVVGQSGEWHDYLGDSVHVIADNGEVALQEAKRHVNERPLYPLATFTPINFRVSQVRALDDTMSEGLVDAINHVEMESPSDIEED